jgi:hypothetical protein
MIFVMAANRFRRRLEAMNAQTITTDQIQHRFESTYGLLARSTEKSRNFFEMLIHPLLLLGPLVAVYQFAQQPVNVPAAGLGKARYLVCVNQGRVAKSEAPALPRHPVVKG